MPRNPAAVVRRLARSSFTPGGRTLLASSDLVEYARKVVQDSGAKPTTGGLRAVVSLDHFFALVFLARIAHTHNPMGRIRVSGPFDGGERKREGGIRSRDTSSRGRGTRGRARGRGGPVRIRLVGRTAERLGLASGPGRRPNVRKHPSEFGYHLEQFPWEVNTIPPPGTLWASQAGTQAEVRADPPADQAIDYWAPDYGPVAVPYLRTGDGTGYMPREILSQGGQGAIVRCEVWDDERRESRDREPRSVVAKLNYRAGRFQRQLAEAFAQDGDDEIDFAELGLDFAETFCDEVAANELMAMTGTPHVVRMLGYPAQPDSFFVMQYLPLGSLEDCYRSEWELVDVWRLFQCLAKAVAVMAWGSEYPDFRVKGWQQIIHMDLAPDNVMVSEEVDDQGLYHTCGAHTCFKVSDFGYTIIWPTGDTVNNPYEDPNVKGLINPERQKQVAIEREKQKYTRRGKTMMPERHYALEPRSDPALAQEVAHNYSWWTNVWQIGDIMYNKDFGDGIKTIGPLPTGEANDVLDEDVTVNGRRSADELAAMSHLGRTAYWQAGRPVDEALSRRRLVRLVARCVAVRPTDRIAIPDLLLEIAKGLKEAGDFSHDSEIVQSHHWEAIAQDEFLVYTLGKAQRDLGSGWTCAEVAGRKLANEVERRVAELQQAGQRLGA